MNDLKKKLKKQGGFTLVEMLIVVAIIAILIMVSIPMINTSLEKARVATDAANLRSAKAEAAIVYLSGDDAIEAGTAITGQYYDITSGKLTGTKPAGYGQSSTYKDQVISVSVSADGVVDCKWGS